MTPQQALRHPWLQKLQGNISKASAAVAGKVPPPIVQRIQRFGAFSDAKRAALERVAGNVLKQHASFAQCKAASGFLDDDVQAAPAAAVAANGAATGAALPQRPSHGHTLSRIAEEGSGDISRLNTALTSRVSDALGLDATGHGSDSAPERNSGAASPFEAQHQSPHATAPLGSAPASTEDLQQLLQQAVDEPTGGHDVTQACGLLEHMMLSDGTVRTPTTCCGMYCTGLIWRLQKSDGGGCQCVLRNTAGCSTPVHHTASSLLTRYINTTQALLLQTVDILCRSTGAPSPRALKRLASASATPTLTTSSSSSPAFLASRTARRCSRRRLRRAR